MKVKVVLGVLLGVMGILALSATAAQAGAGGVVSPLTSFFVCNFINGDAAGKVVDVGPNTLDLAGRTSVTIGNGALACAPVFLYYPNGTEIEPGTGNDLKCYSVSVAKKTSAPGQRPLPYEADDTLLGSETDIQASEIKYICGPSTFNLSSSP